jgi:hypothetical protein
VLPAATPCDEVPTDLRGIAVVVYQRSEPELLPVKHDTGFVRVPHFDLTMKRGRLPKEVKFFPRSIWIPG